MAGNASRVKVFGLWYYITTDHCAPAIGKGFAFNAHRRMDVVKELGRLRMLEVDQESARHH
jgi:hypothetical protein